MSDRRESVLPAWRWPAVLGLARSWNVAIGVLVFAAAHGFFLAGLSYPQKLYFDEVHYVPPARQMLAGEDPQNIEHPPFGKELIAIGIALFGDNPVGWRYMSALFGALTVVGIYVWGLCLFQQRSPALWATGITLTNQVLYVQSRIAMLDIFLVAFFVWAMAMFSATWRARRVRWLFTATGALVGATISCKWVGVASWAMIVGIVIGVKVLQQWGTRFDHPDRLDWYRPDLWQGMTAWDWIVSLALVPLIVYFATFVPVYGVSIAGFLQHQIEMWNSISAGNAPHPNMSRWVEWPILRRSVNYFFELEGPGQVSFRSVFFLGNPVVFWTGILAILVTFHGWLIGRRWDAFLMFAAWFSSYAFWAIAPRQVTFLFYYLPSAMVLGLALAYLFQATPLARWRWMPPIFAALSLGCFVYFFQITSAAVTLTIPEFNNLMWFESWR